MLRTAIAGAERQPVAAPDAQQLGIAPQADAGYTAIYALAAAQLIERAAAPLADAPAQLPEPCPPDERPYCSPAASELLVMLAREPDYSPMLYEFFQILHRQGKCLPPAALPLALDVLARRMEPFPLALEVLGQRGRWLARQHPGWQSVLPASEPAHWETASGPERRRLLQETRRQQPLLALDWLEKTWPTESPKDRETFLLALRQGLSAADERLLERALTDRSKPVRRAALRLLLLLPESRVCQELEALIVRTGPSAGIGARCQALSSQLPPEGSWSKTALLALWPEKATGFDSIWLLLAPPALLAQAAGQTPDVFLQETLENPPALLEAGDLIRNMAWRGEAPWLMAASRWLARHPAHPLWQLRASGSILVQLPPEEWRAVLDAVSTHPELLDQADSALVAALASSPQPWPRSWLDQLIRYPSRDKTYISWFAPPHIEALIRRAAFVLEPSLVHSLPIVYPDMPYTWQLELARLRDKLALRLRLRQVLA
ncbi:MAG: hypothetical protein JNK89_00505 [Saprospiraceae bacterium]|nr:hypothetical protein [Saprospiraceae bacterium]